jgi:hypothetical protein
VAGQWTNVARGAVLAVSMVVIGASGAAPLPAVASSVSQTVMCMATGERTSGFNKICFYDCLGSTQTVTQSATSLCRLSINGPLPGAVRTPAPPETPRGGQVTCFARGEQASGMNKICYYDCLGSARAVTQSAVSLCPLTITQ